MPDEETFPVDDAVGVLPVRRPLHGEGIEPNEHEIELDEADEAATAVLRGVDFEPCQHPVDVKLLQVHEMLAKLQLDRENDSYFKEYG